MNIALYIHKHLIIFFIKKIIIILFYNSATQTVVRVPVAVPVAVRVPSSATGTARKERNNRKTLCHGRLPGYLTH